VAKAPFCSDYVVEALVHHLSPPGSARPFPRNLLREPGKVNTHLQKFQPASEQEGRRLSANGNQGGDPEAWRDTLGAAPPEGRIDRLLDHGYQVFVPSGWRLDAEQDPRTGEGRPIWYRAENPHGAIRITRYGVEQRRIGGKGDPLRFARWRYQKQRGNPNIRDLSIEDTVDRVRLSWIEVVKPLGQDHTTTAYVWATAESKGELLISFTYDSRLLLTDDLNRELRDASEMATGATLLESEK